MKTIHIEIVADIGDTVFLKTDTLQIPRLVVEIRMLPAGLVVYGLNAGNNSSLHYGFEISQVVNILAKT